MPKIWTKSEIQRLIVDEINEYRMDCYDQQKKPSTIELGELIYEKLNESNLLLIALSD